MKPGRRHIGRITRREGDPQLNNEDNVLNGSSGNMAESFLKAADEVETIADALAADVETWGAEYAAALRRRAYALSS